MPTRSSATVKALGGAPTDFDEGFERRDRVREADYDRKRSL
jgi:hypothetical protein